MGDVATFFIAPYLLWDITDDQFRCTLVVNKRVWEETEFLVTRRAGDNVQPPFEQFFF